MPLYSRNINVKIEEIDDHLIKAEATMESLFEVAQKKEIFFLEVVITKKDFMIKEIKNVEIVGLSNACLEVIPKLQNIIGLTVTAGYNKRIREIADGAEGCTHIAELFIEIGRCVFQAHHGQILADQGIDACIDSFKEISKVTCLGVSKHKK